MVSKMRLTSCAEPVMKTAFITVYGRAGLRRRADTVRCHGLGRGGPASPDRGRGGGADARAGPRGRAAPRAVVGPGRARLLPAGPSPRPHAARRGHPSDAQVLGPAGEPSAG